MLEDGPAWADWDSRRGAVRSERGQWVVGQGVINCGYSMLDELVGEVSFFQVLVLNATGRLPTAEFAVWLENTFICMSWPDPRIWCNQLGALGGAAGVSPVAAICMGVLASDSMLYGPGSAAAVVRFMQRGLAAVVREGLSVEDYLSRCVDREGKLLIPGYARPVARGDERIAAMQRVERALGLAPGDHLKLAYDIEAVLYREHGETLNHAGYMYSFMLDQGYSEKDIYCIYSLSVNSGIHACFAEYRDRPADAFLPLRCADIEYRGVGSRPVPRPTEHGAPRRRPPGRRAE